MVAHLLSFDSNVKIDYTKYPNYPPYQLLANIVHVDQFDPMHYQLGCPTFRDILAMPQCTKSYEELVLERCEYFRKLDKKIYVMYSGGIDSTAFLTAMMYTWPKEDLEKINIIMSYFCIIEYPENWPIINKMFHGRIYNGNQNIAPLIDENSILLTGEGGDQLFGSDVIIPTMRALGEQAIFEPWEPRMKLVFDYMFNGQHTKPILMGNALNEWFQNIADSTKECPFKLKTCFDFGWWFNYTNKYNHVIYRILVLYSDLAKHFDRIHHFYITDEFMRWALDNHESDRKVNNTFLSYKKVAKQMIFKYNKDDSYMGKPKFGSLGTLFYRSPETIDKAAVNINAEFMSLEETNKYVRH